MQIFVSLMNAATEKRVIFTARALRKKISFHFFWISSLHPVSHSHMRPWLRQVARYGKKYAYLINDWLPQTSPAELSAPRIFNPGKIQNLLALADFLIDDGLVKSSILVCFLLKMKHFPGAA